MDAREHLFGRPTILSSGESTYFSKWYHFSTSSIFLLTLQQQLKAPTGETKSCSTIHWSLFQAKILVFEDLAKGSGPDRYLWQGRRQDILELEISTAALTNDVDIDPVTQRLRHCVLVRPAASPKTLILLQGLLRTSLLSMIYLLFLRWYFSK